VSDAASIAVAMLLTLGGIAIAAALFPIRDLCLEARAQSRAWLAVPALAVLFITAYAVFAVALANREAIDLSVLVAAAAICGAGCFMWAFAYISGMVVRESRRVAALERHRAAHDELTGLPNRAFFVRQLEEAVGASAGQKRLALLIIDLDRFKLINDALGHRYGDILLQEVANRLRGALRMKDLVARLGGDEFGVLIDPVINPEHLKTIGEHVTAVLQSPVAVEDYPTDVGVSIGVAYYPEHGSSGNEMIKNAEIAMYEAKRRGADVVVYEPTFDTNGFHRLDILNELRQAIDGARLLLHYQPQFAAKSGRLVGVEALVRWPHPRLGLLLPNEFIGLAEQSGLINRLNRWVLNIVFEQLAAWQTAGIDMPIATNVSVLNLQDPDLLQYVMAGLANHGLAAGRLRLEITETAVMSDPEAALGAVKRLAELGVRFSIDDFGTGYSSLRYLRELPVDEIKIDRSFIVDSARDANDAIIARSTIDLAHNMGRLVAAEGVESRETAELLAHWNCDTLQGFYLCPPLAIHELAPRLADPSWTWRSSVHAT
jgi:diguanylate cyclase (GGDEF)-like protein